MIPGKIHYCWYGDRPMPDAHRRFVDGWRELMPGFEFVFWNEENSPMSEPYLEQAHANRRWVNLSNFIRLYSVYNHGGIYLDTDVEMVRSFVPLLGQSRCFFGYQIASRAPAENSVNNAVYGAEKHHPFVGRQLDAIRVLYDGLETECLSGPHLTTFMLRGSGFLDSEPAGENELGLTVFPFDYFYPYSWLESFDPACVTENTYAIHHWAGLWGEPDKRPSALTSIARLIGLGR